MLDDQLLDEFVARMRTDGVRLSGPGGFLTEMLKAVLERGLQAELTDHLGYDKHEAAGRGTGNSRNGATPKTVLTEVGPVPLEVQRDRAGTFTPALVPKGERRLGGLPKKYVRPGHYLLVRAPFEQELSDRSTLLERSLNQLERLLTAPTLNLHPHKEFANATRQTRAKQAQRGIAYRGDLSQSREDVCPRARVLYPRGASLVLVTRHVRRRTTPGAASGPDGR
jgi:hypothetical protein